MKNLKTFLGIFTLITVSAFAFHTCKKATFETQTMKQDQTHALVQENPTNALSTVNCDTFPKCPSHCEGIDTFIVREIGNEVFPLLPDSCTIEIMYKYIICCNQLRFYEFSLSFDSASCGLSSPDSLNLAKFLEKYLKEIAIVEHIDRRKTPVVEVRTFQYHCSKWCKYYPPDDTIIIDPPGGRLINIPKNTEGFTANPTSDRISYQYRDNNNDANNGKPYRWVRVKCGIGCCITYAEYSKDENGNAILLSANTEAVSDCKSGRDWPLPCCYKCDGKWPGGACINYCYYYLY